MPEECEEQTTDLPNLPNGIGWWLGDWWMWQYAGLFGWLISCFDCCLHSFQVTLLTRNWFKCGSVFLLFSFSPWWNSRPLLKAEYCLYDHRAVDILSKLTTLYMLIHCHSASILHFRSHQKKRTILAVLTIFCWWCAHDPNICKLCQFHWENKFQDPTKIIGFTSFTYVRALSWHVMFLNVFD